jgi:dolichyl-phosphate beta-glucosyltransferase
MAKLLHAIDAGADVAIGSRIATDEEQTTIERHWYRHLVGQLFNVLVRAFAVPGFYDTQCGFKMFRLPVAKALFTLQKIKGFAFDVEILYLCQKLGFHVVEIPIDWTHKPGSKVSVVRDSIFMFVDLCRIHFLHMFATLKDQECIESLHAKVIPQYDGLDNRVQ